MSAYFKFLIYIFFLSTGQTCLFSSLYVWAADFDRCNGLLLKDQRSHQEREGTRKRSAQKDKEAGDTSTALYTPEMACRKRPSSTSQNRHSSSFFQSLHHTGDLGHIGL